MRSLNPFLFLVFVTTNCFSQQNNEELIDWKSSQQLKWSDYKGSPNPSSDAAAATTTYLGIEYNIDGNALTYKIQCRFSKTRSWGRSQTEYLLAHEQGHFDIAEIFARRLHKKMSEYKYNESSFRTDLKAIYDGITSGKENMQNQYDLETDHSRKKDEQSAWIKKIADMLKELQDYSNY
jgi:hypothetical protein